ncbi:MAG TPA: hypothetical protein VI749_00205 [Candidatus Omnitrophota bacterium]|nr:hypothetical protein [Candidatus Omnitrophota bacterium]
MSFNDFMNQIRQWDNTIAKWLMRHFYFMFFQLVLLIIFGFWLTNTVQMIDVSFQLSESSLMERLAVTQTINTSIIVLILLLNSFWVLYVFNGIQRIRNILKDINFNISKLRFKEK